MHHQISISKLECYGIHGILLNWFKSCLTKRHQFVEINNAQSKTLFNEYGAPQGSVLEPIHCTMLPITLHNATNDLHNAIYQLL